MGVLDGLLPMRRLGPEREAEKATLPGEILEVSLEVRP